MLIPLKKSFPRPERHTGRQKAQGVLEQQVQKTRQMIPMEKEVQSLLDKGRKGRKAADKPPVQQHGPPGMRKLRIQESKEPSGK